MKLHLRQWRLENDAQQPDGQHGAKVTLIRQDDTSRCERSDRLRERAPRRAQQCFYGAIRLEHGRRLGPFSPELFRSAKSWTRAPAIHRPKSSAQRDIRAARQLRSDRNGNPTRRPPKVVSWQEVIRDGDWNIAMKWAADTRLRTIPTKKSERPEAMKLGQCSGLHQGRESITPYVRRPPKWVSTDGPAHENQRTSGNGV